MRNPLPALLAAALLVSATAASAEDVPTQPTWQKFGVQQKSVMPMTSSLQHPGPSARCNTPQSKRMKQCGQQASGGTPSGKHF